MATNKEWHELSEMKTPIVASMLKFLPNDLAKTPEWDSAFEYMRCIRPGSDKMAETMFENFKQAYLELAECVRRRIVLDQVPLNPKWYKKNPKKDAERCIRVKTASVEKHLDALKEGATWVGGRIDESD